MKDQLTDHEARLFFDVAGKLLEAMRQDRSNSLEATKALSGLYQQLGARLGSLEKQVVEKVDGAATKTATEAANLLQENFKQADVAARKAADLYREAAKGLAWQRWMYYVGAQVVLVLLGALLITTLVPSLDEIRDRRQALTELNHEIESRRWNLATCDKDLCVQLDKKRGRGGLFDEEGGNTWCIPKRK